MEERHGGTRTGRSPDRLVTNPMSEYWKITVDREALPRIRCVRGNRTPSFPARRRQVRAIRADIEPDDIVLDVADTCPAEAIAVHDAAGHRLAPDTT
jgi:ferredoxin